MNQFVLLAYTKDKIKLYQENYKRSFAHVQNVFHAIMCVINSLLNKVRNQVFNVGS